MRGAVLERVSEHSQGGDVRWRSHPSHGLCQLLASPRLCEGDKPSLNPIPAPPYTASSLSGARSRAVAVGIFQETSFTADPKSRISPPHSPWVESVDVQRIGRCSANRGLGFRTSNGLTGQNGFSSQGNSNIPPRIPLHSGGLYPIRTTSFSSLQQRVSLRNSTPC